MRVKPGDGYKDIPEGGLVVEPGNSQEYKTGGWRTQRPEIDQETCTDCFLCAIFCPDYSIEHEDDEVTGIDLEYCKGCGICANECPVDAIEMKQE